MLYPELQAKPVRGKGDQNTLMFDIGGVLLVLMNMGAALPSGWEPAVKRAERQWPKVGEVFAQHRSHIVVSTIGNTRTALEASRLMTAVVGAVLQSEPAASGVMWNGTAGRRAEAFSIAAKTAFAPFPRFPFPMWIDVQFFNVKETVTVVALTAGLQKFVGREIEFETAADGARDLGNWVYGLAAYLMQNIGTVKDGDTIGMSQTERIRISKRLSQHFNELPVFSGKIA